MEGIKSLAQSFFDHEQKFLDPPRGYKYDAVELCVYPDSTKQGGVGDPNDPKLASPTLLSFSQEGLCAWLSSVKRDSALRLPEVTLRLVRIRRELDVSLVISQASFTQVFDLMKADPSIKYMICRDYDGFHEYHADGFRLTRFIGTSLYALVWTFDPTSMATTALFLDRRRQSFPKFVDVLWEFRSCIYTPSLLGFVSCYFLLLFFDHETGGWELETIRHVERQTGFGPHPTGWRGLEPLDLVEKFHINQLTSWLQAVTEVAGNVGSRARHQRTSLALLETIREERENGKHHGISGHALGGYQDSIRVIGEAIPSVERHMSTYIDFLVYLKDRAERLSGVLFALLTHEDADASIGLAAASKRDSSSMKTVAIMTMAFLPATFFAALFAMPSLQWDRPSVVQDNFWVYWAFTVPTTVAVFLVWLLITERKWICRKAADLYGVVKKTSV
ncbi:hypothetical protein DL766_010311 [Monosporascus sp. MC13-8B]|uniref:Uncharacterized protein n=1 Tax=Monosporascus cannonballus TaxID=155416 RepID=A0ABY0H0F1_9PEZI|nr:hypothetical protein DL762_008469 [Monosporascus cannonballus]RYO83897.1 hypothetical protein DL763_007669 [Monosporascus cannonballus]RYP02484.1 hypothetical protein DL766_010311 [Monosporascus sp. MC13-8B]